MSWILDIAESCAQPPSACVSADRSVLPSKPSGWESTAMEEPASGNELWDTCL